MNMYRRPPQFFIYGASGLPYLEEWLENIKFNSAREVGLDNLGNPKIGLQMLDGNEAIPPDQRGMIICLNGKLAPAVVAVARERARQVLKTRGLRK